MQTLKTRPKNISTKSGKKDYGLIEYMFFANPLAGILAILALATLGPAIYIESRQQQELIVELKNCEARK